MQAHLPGFRRRLGELSSPALLDGLSRFVNSVAAVRRRLAGPPRTNLHGDFRQDNLFFADQAGTPLLTVVDWGSCGRGPGVVDLAYFAAMSLEPASRRALEQRLVGTYRRALIEQGVCDYGLERCWEDYGIATLHVAETWIWAGANLYVRGDRTREWRAGLRRCEALLEDYPVDELLASGGH